MEMEGKVLFERFERDGKLMWPGGTAAFRELPWSAHPTFVGVELKQIVAAERTAGRCSFHLVRIAPHGRIETHVHEAQLETHEVIAGRGICIRDGLELTYAPGTVSVLPANVPHAVIAGEHGLCLFAKFMPALA